MQAEAGPDPDRAFLFDIVHGIRMALRYVKDMSREQFDQDTKTQDAVIRRLTVVGEAAKRVSAGFRERHPEIPWKQMAGMRDVIVHEYDRIDLDTVWNVLRVELPQLPPRLEASLEP